MRRRRLVLVLASAHALACGPGVQRAALSPALAEGKVADAEPAREARLVLAPESRVVVAAKDVARGTHPLRFDKIRGKLRVGPAGAGHLRFELDMATLRGENGFAESLAQSMLEVNRFPHATLVARIEPAEAPDTRLVTGNVVVHGVERGISFKAKMKQDGEAWRLHAVFELSRSAFGIKADGAWDPLIRDDFRVTFDFRGMPDAAADADPDAFGAGGR